MTFFQILLIAVVIVAALLAVRALPGEKSLAVKRLIAFLFVLAAIAAILFPQLLSNIANFLGIGRGTDLLLYSFVLVALLYAAMSARSKARSDARVTELARQVALIEAASREPNAKD